MNNTELNSASKITPWFLFSLVVILPFIGWANSLNWQFELLSLYTVFPLLGLLAWGIMWTHYAYGAIFLSLKSFKRNQLYSRLSGYVVLVLILLHPGLLTLAQWQGNKTLPPTSFYNYTGDSMKLYVILGSTALLAFLLYEVLHRFRSNSQVKKLWPIVSIIQMIAMVFIFIHGLSLGQHLQSGWLQFYWVILGVMLIPSFVIVGKSDWTKNNKTS